MEEKETIIGVIDNYIYESKDSLYKVCELILEDESTIIIVGSFPRLDEGLAYEFRGYFKEHTKYGRQFVVESYAKSDSLEELDRCMESNVIICSFNSFSVYTSVLSSFGSI